MVLRGSTLPARLNDLPIVPEVLYVRGELPRGAAVAVVGTRHPSAGAKTYARRLARELAAANVAVLSGGAFGIDAQAHRGALDARGTTVVVAPSGWLRPVPRRHRRLYHRIVGAGGAHVALVGSETDAALGAYFARNAVLAALAHVVVVIEAPYKSGARNTAAMARRLGRPLFVCGAPPWHSKGLGCVAELRLGARPLASVRDILRCLAEQNAHPLPPLSAGGPHETPEQRVSETVDKTRAKSRPCNDASATALLLETIRAGARYADELCARTGLPVQRVQELLLTLRLDGVLVSDDSGRVTLLTD